MFWPFVVVDGELAYCPLADFGGANVDEGTQIQGEVVVAQPLTACEPLLNAERVNGNIVVVERGGCDFVTKALHAQNAGAIALLVANTNRETPDEAFVMDTGTRQMHEWIDTIKIPVMMLSYVKAAVLFEQVRESYLDRHEYTLTIRFLGAQAAVLAMEQIENTYEKLKRQEEDIRKQRERVQQQKEATELLRSRLGKVALESPRATSHKSRTSTSPSESSYEKSGRPTPERESYSTTRFLEESYETVSITSSGEVYDVHRTVTPGFTMNHWCPMTTALVIVDIQNYFTLEQNENCLEPLLTNLQHSYYKRIKTIMFPNIQDVLLACRSCAGMEVIYSIVESATTDGRDRSRAHKQAGLHVPRGGFGAKIPTRVAPTENDIVIPRTGINIFEATNVDYVLRNLGVSHVVLMGISVLNTIQLCAQTALDRGYQVSLLRDAITAPTPEQLQDTLEHCEKLGAQIMASSAFVEDLHGFSETNQLEEAYLCD